MIPNPHPIPSIRNPLLRMFGIVEYLSETYGTMEMSSGGTGKTKETGDTGMFHDLQIKSVLVYIENRISSVLAVEEVAKVAGYDSDYFRGVFRRSTNMTLSRYIKVRRLSNAAFDLRNSRVGITDIALKYGFNSHDVFIRAFKREFGTTPSEFRKGHRRVRGAQVTPGVFVPTLDKTEDVPEMHDETTDSAILYGVPKVTYFKGTDPEITPFISSLRACLTYAGQDISYDRLLAGSGAAFRLMWNTKCWDGGNVDIMVMREDPFEPMRKAFETAGRGWTLLPKYGTPANKQGMIDLIKGSINAGKPLIALGIIGPPEACVITGYKEDGEVLTGWNYFQEMPEWRGSTEFEPCGYFSRRNWYGHSETKAIMAVGEMTTPGTGMGFLKDTLSLALEVMTTPAVGDFAGGQAAFTAWEMALADDAEFPGNAPLPMLMERLMCQMDAFSMVAEGRHYAGLFFEGMSAEVPELKGRLLELAESCKRTHMKVWEMHGPMGGMGMGEDQARRLAEPGVRRELISLIRQAAELDGNTRNLISELLREI